METSTEQELSLSWEELGLAQEDLEHFCVKCKQIDSGHQIYCSYCKPQQPLHVKCKCTVNVLAKNLRRHFKTCSWIRDHGKNFIQGLVDKFGTVEAASEALRPPQRKRKFYGELTSRPAKKQRRQTLRECLVEDCPSEKDLQHLLKDFLLEDKKRAAAVFSMLLDDEGFARSIGFQIWCVRNEQPTTQKMSEAPEGPKLLSVHEAACLLRGDRISKRLYQAVRTRTGALPTLDSVYKNCLNLIPVPKLEPTVLGDGAIVSSLADTILGDFAMQKRKDPSCFNYFAEFPKSSYFRKQQYGVPGCLNHLLRVQADDCKIGKAIGEREKHVEGIQLRHLNEIGASHESPSQQQIVGVYEPLKGKKHEQFIANTQTIFNDLRTLAAKPFVITSAPVALPNAMNTVLTPAEEVDTVLENDFNSFTEWLAYVDEPPAIVEQLAPSMVLSSASSVSSTVAQEKRTPQADVTLTPGVVQVSETSLYSHIVKHYALEPHDSNQLHQLIPFLSADDPELRRFNGSAGCTSETFCGFCNRLRSEFSSALNNLPPHRLHKLSTLLQWGTEAAPITELVKRAKECQRELKKLNPEDEKFLAAELAFNDATKAWKKALATQLKIEDWHKITEKNHLKQFYADRGGQRFPPLFPDLPLKLKGPCCLHMQLCMCVVNVRETKNILAAYGLMNEWIAELSRWNLLFMKSFMDVSDDKDIHNRVTQLHLNGEDCRKLEKKMPKFVQSLLDRHSSPSKPSCEKDLQKIKHLWDLWSQVCPLLRKVRLENLQEKRDLKEAAIAYVDFYRQEFSKPTYYMHFLRDHVASWTKTLFKEFGFGYGIMTTQGLEHRQKILKKDFEHTTQREEKWSTVIDHQNQRLYGELNQVETVKRKLRFVCACGESHQRNKKSCPFYSED